MRFGQIEDALCELFSIPLRTKFTFRARIRHLQKSGVVPSAPGRGQKIDYRAEDAWRWALAMQLNACGVGASEISGVMADADRTWAECKPGEIWLLDRSFMAGWTFRRWTSDFDRRNPNSGAMTLIWLGDLRARLYGLLTGHDALKKAA